jgi:hypothetical protein
MPRGRKKGLKINKESNSMSELEEKLKEQNGKLKEEVDNLSLPEKELFKEVEIGVDLTNEDGKTPIAVVFECVEERAVHVEWEYSDGTRGNYHFDAFPLRNDAVGKELKRSEGKGRSFTNAYCIPAKRILKCNADKIYVIY